MFMLSLSLYCSMGVTWFSSKPATWHALYKARSAFALQLPFTSSVRMNIDVEIMLKLRDGGSYGGLRHDVFRTWSFDGS
jgi:hypothetical protein